MNRRKLLYVGCLLLIVGNLIIGFPMRKMAYGQTIEEKIKNATRTIYNPTINEGEQAVLELLRKVTANEAISASYFEPRRTKILAAMTESDRAGFCRLVTSSIFELTQRYDSSLTPEVKDKLRSAGVSQAYIDKVLQTPESDIIRWVEPISQRGCEAYVRTLLDQSAQEIAANRSGVASRHVSARGTSMYSCLFDYLGGIATFITVLGGSDDGPSVVLGGFSGFVRAQLCNHGNHT